MKTSFSRTLVSILILLCLISALSSCSTVQYSDIVDCSYITSSIKTEYPLNDGYSEYSSEEINYMLEPSLFDSCSVIYSNSSDNIDEIGVFHAKDKASADILLENITQYVESVKKEKSDFLRNYLPSEISKLESGEVKQFGNYVVFAFSENSGQIFKQITNILR